MALKTFQTGLSRALSRLVVTLAVSAWVFTTQTCLLGDEAVAAPLLPTSHAHLADDTAPHHEGLDHCELALSPAIELVQPVAMAPPIKTAALAPLIKTAAILTGSAGLVVGVSALADTRPRGRYRYFAPFWSHAPPADHA